MCNEMARMSERSGAAQKQAAAPAAERLQDRLQKRVDRLRKASKGLGITSATIVTLRIAGEVVGYQLRLGTKIVKGLTAHFGVSSFGGELQARAAAAKVAEGLGLTISQGRGGSTPGRRNKNSTSPEGGIRFFWVDRQVKAPVLFVGTNWKERDGRLRTTCYSTDTNGLKRAIERAVEKRIAAGYPRPNRAALVREAMSVKEQGPPKRRSQNAGRERRQHRT